jgi:hypothetical protein
LRRRRGRRPGGLGEYDAVRGEHVRDDDDPADRRPGGRALGEVVEAPD